MNLRLHNTLTKKVDEFAPLYEKSARPSPDGDKVRIYSCGPTVYNHAHIGNLSAYIYADILRRAVNLAGFSTEHVMNFTDVDDKTIRDSRLQFPELPPEEALEKLTRHYEKVFLGDMAQIGNDVSKYKFVRATENIAEIQDLIRKLLEQKIAYIADDGIYFSISEYQKSGRIYGQLSKIEPAKDTISRIDNDEYDKESVQDFALWKVEKSGEPSWDFEIDGQNLRGRPGWHIECSAMSVKNLGQPFDIHTGGVDLIFPHHENEIAQSTAGNQPEKLAEFFVHNEHLLVDGAKMSKSKNNFYTLPDIIEKGFDSLDFRMLVLQSHYRSATNFSWENLESAKNRRRNWRNLAELRWQIKKDSSQDFHFVAGLADGDIDAAKTSLLGDLNTPEALRAIDLAVNILSEDEHREMGADSLESLFEFIDNNLGLKILETTPDISESQKNLIQERQIARAEKNFAKSDEIRDELLKQGITLNDTGDRTIWARV